ncbi:type II toxin-antitoxin system death-on-curing family toxin [Methylotenera sp.]|uniref:type II toxin-antitoxin system death-on-curing family toxin n=1 Tax=Methylotenera sp. TaxID=2051956 RepID=UPI00248A7465|nr:type II toxin-antitoxin system death-on-curing family toxin [Methylotenera sp.]MDI1297581.1 type II toxin-antitoxin system death-on-curing family toxin [Methylotenera sp.]
MTRQQNQYWVWLPQAIILAVHDEQLAEHGGLSGVRDEGLLISALARPEHLAAYSTPDFAELAASYGYGIARNHPFIDGNKRTAFVATLLFLHFNGFSLKATDTDKVLTMLKVAAGEITESDFASWLRSHSHKI